MAKYVRGRKLTSSKNQTVKRFIGFDLNKSFECLTDLDSISKFENHFLNYFTFSLNQ